MTDAHALDDALLQGTAIIGRHGVVSASWRQRMAKRLRAIQRRRDDAEERREWWEMTADAVRDSMADAPAPVRHRPSARIVSRLEPGWRAAERESSPPWWMFGPRHINCRCTTGLARMDILVEPQPVDLRPAILEACGEERFGEAAKAVLDLMDTQGGGGYLDEVAFTVGGERWTLRRWLVADADPGWISETVAIYREVTLETSAIDWLLTMIGQDFDDEPITPVCS